jgi:hypothetical protein
VTNTLAAGVSEYRKLKGSTWCSLLGWRMIVLRRSRHRYGQLSKTVKTDVDANTDRVRKKRYRQK